MIIVIQLHMYSFCWDDTPIIIALRFTNSIIAIHKRLYHYTLQYTRILRLELRDWSRNNSWSGLPKRLVNNRKISRIWLKFKCAAHNCARPQEPIKMMTKWKSRKEMIIKKCEVTRVQTVTKTSASNFALYNCNMQSRIFFHPSCRMSLWRWARPNTVRAASWALALLPNKIGMLSMDYKAFK